MSRDIIRRWELCGTLVATSPVHVGSLDSGVLDAVHARDGLGRPVIPGTTLAGVIRAALLTQASPEELDLWGREIEVDEYHRDIGTGDASWVRIDDAVADTSSDLHDGEFITQIRQHVSIDRIHGTAARGHLFSREVLLPGTRFRFRMVVDDPGKPSAESLVRRVADLLQSPGIAVGGGITKGYGRVRLKDPTLRRFDLRTRAGMIAMMRGRGIEVPLSASERPGTISGTLRVIIPWQPRGPLLVQVSAAGDVVDAFPFTSTVDGRVHLEVPGDTIKGVLRTHAERIVRTATGVRAPERFLTQMQAEELPAVAALFGTARDHDLDNAARSQRGALTVCASLSRNAMPREAWQRVRMIKERQDESSPHSGDRRAALARLQDAVDQLNRETTGIWFGICPHVAVDRWTGAAAEGLLFAVLEPHARDSAWEPFILELDVARLSAHPAAAQTASVTPIALLLLLLRDLCDGWIAFGHATTRGMGAVRVSADEVMFETRGDVGGLRDLDGRSLADVLDDPDLTRRLTASWLPAAAGPRATEEGATGDERDD